jgi:hypothetical protein
MRILIGLLVSFLAMTSSFADNTLTPITDLSEFSGANSANNITWSNQRPEQQRALNQFYRSMNPSVSSGPALERQQRAQELRSMSPQQRQQLFLNYIKQNR